MSDSKADNEEGHPYGSNIPLAREKLQTIARKLREGEMGCDTAADEIENLVNDPIMYRRHLAKATRRRHPPLTEDQIADILLFYLNTGLSQQSIAVRCRTNAGRVSETIAKFELEKRKAGEPDGTE